jgi:hypothetical protein
MNLLGWLRRHDRQPLDTPTRGEFDALTHRVVALDEVQLHRELEWTELRDQLTRQLGRMAAYDQRARARADGQSDNGTASLRELLAVKYPKLLGGD